MKLALVTGADGFIGSHLTERLLKEGYRVRALAQYNSFNNWGWLEDVTPSKDMEIVSGDVRDPFFCETITRKVDTIFHLAALIAIPFSYVAPQSYVETNITGTLNMCEAARKNGCERLIHTSTSEVYGTAKYVPIDEKHPLQPQSPYSATKIGADNIALSYFHAYNSPVIVGRPFNTYGPRQSARAIIPTIVAQILSKKNKISLGDLTPTRDFNYVTDTCNGFLALAKESLEKVKGQVFNISSNNEISVLNLVEKIKSLMGSSIEIEKDEKRLRPADSEVFRLCGDNTKLKALVGFKSEVDLDLGLEKTIEWFSQAGNLKKYKAGIYNV